MKYAFFLGFLLLVTVTAFAYSTRFITGTVTDDAGKPIIAYIYIKKTSTGVSSGADGHFRIQVTDDKAILVITAAGYELKEIPVGKQLLLTIRLQASVQALEEVVVTGYQAQKKKEITGSVAALNAGSYVSVGSGNPMAANSHISGYSIGAGIDMLHDQKSLSGDIRYKFLPGNRGFNREGYDHIPENPFLTVDNNPLSTFSIDVDAASYSNIRRILKSGQLPTEGAVRIEEMINYFSYEYDQPTGKDPFAVHTELSVCPWNPKHQLALVGLQGKKIDAAELPACNLTFLIDVSGSMFMPDKLPLVKTSLKLLVDQLRPQDQVAIVAYAGNAGLVMPSTPGDRKINIKEAIERLEAGGSTAGGAGIQLAYKIAKDNFNKEGNNRVILCTDGDFNVGTSSDDALEKLIEEERKSGVYLTVLGFGTGNYQDAKMQKLADKGNGNHAYIDNINEAKKVLINEFGGTLFTIAKDVKLQVEFNPAKVKGYRLIGYENRMLAKEDFNNDQKDAGDLGSGHTVTALYELIPPGVDIPKPNSVDSLRYQIQLNALTTQQQKYSDEVMMIKLRYKQPDSETSTLMSYPVKGKPVPIDQASTNFRFASAVASFGMLLRNSEYKGDASYSFAKYLAEAAIGKDKEGYRKDFVQLIDMASAISKRKEMVKNEE